MSNDKTPDNSKTWVERMKERGEPKSYNEDNNRAKGKSLYEIKPAAASDGKPNVESKPSEGSPTKADSSKQEPPKPTVSKQSFVDKINKVPIKTSPTTPSPPKGPKR